MNDESPALARELLSASDKLLERVLLETRLSNGIDSGLISRPEVLHELVAEGLMVHNANGQFTLTRTGRLLADAVVHRLVD
jgi:oxygen-independent coproporphyrinogen-3 oxidase